MQLYKSGKTPGVNSKQPEDLLHGDEALHALKYPLQEIYYSQNPSGPYNATTAIYWNGSINAVSKHRWIYPLDQSITNNKVLERAKSTSIESVLLKTHLCNVYRMENYRPTKIVLYEVLL